MTGDAETTKTDSYSATLRSRAWRAGTRELLVARIAGSAQEDDLSTPPNCRGLGRRRHFRRETSPGWPSNSLPIDPASRYLQLESDSLLVAQVFQNLACNWRCWYCYVPFNLLGGNPRLGEFVTADALVDLLLAEKEPSHVIDISGGQPDLVPEWTLDTLKALEVRGLDASIYVWSDDNLSTDGLWCHLSASEIRWMASRPNHGRVGCFKGFDASSFSFNTGAEPELFGRQFELFDRLRKTGFDIYGYITLTTPNSESIERGIPILVDRLQSIHSNLPLRIVPLEIGVFGPVEARLNESRNQALDNQHMAIAAWKRELEIRFTPEQLEMGICDVDISS